MINQNKVILFKIRLSAKQKKKKKKKKKKSNNNNKKKNQRTDSPKSLLA